jgi:hypothetical protein
VCSYCKADYFRLFAARCAGCNKQLEEGKPYKQALNKKWHPDGCLVCATCKKPFPDGNFYERDGKPYCKQDYEKNAYTCKKCAKPILEKAMGSGSDKYHVECFICSICSKGLSTFVCVDGQLYCDEDARKLELDAKCALCQGVLSGTYVEAMGKRFHVDHFNCGKCKANIGRGKFSLMKLTDETLTICSACQPEARMETVNVHDVDVEETEANVVAMPDRDADDIGSAIESSVQGKSTQNDKFKVDDSELPAQGETGESDVPDSFLRIEPADFKAWDQADSKVNIVEEVDDKGRRIVKAGTVHKLVERLTYQCFSDPQYTYLFMLTFRSFLPPEQLLLMLYTRFYAAHSDTPSEQDAKAMHQIRLRVCNVLKFWTQNYPSDFPPGGELHKIMSDFILVLDRLPECAMLL